VLNLCTADTDNVCKLTLPPDNIPGIILAAPTVGTQTANTSAMFFRYMDCAGKHLHLVDIGQ